MLCRSTHKQHNTNQQQQQQATMTSNTIGLTKKNYTIGFHRVVHDAIRVVNFGGKIRND